MSQTKDLRVLKALQALLNEYSIENLLDESGEIPVLKARLCDLGSVTGKAMMEICEYPFATHRLLQFYTTTAERMDEENLIPAARALDRVNLRCPLGAFGVYEPLRQMYHKYTAVLDDAPEDCACSALTAVVEVLDRLFDETIIIADHAQNAPGDKA